MKKPVVATYASNVTDKTAPVFNDSYYASAYADLFRFVIEKGGDPIVVYGAEENYLGEGKFGQYWRAVLAGGKIHYKKVESDVEVNLVYDKSHFPFDDVRMVNSSKVRRMCGDKYLSYLLAPDFHPDSYLVENEGQLAELVAKYGDELVAIKELVSSGGKKVFVGKASSYKSGELEMPLIFQEFIDTRGGATGIAEGVHDVRVGIFDDEPICGLLRQPMREGELKSNFALGGSVRELYVREIPEELIEKTRDVGRRFEDGGPMFFCADWGFDRQTDSWRMFELNSFPGLAHESVDGPAANEFLELLAENLVRSAS